MVEASLFSRAPYRRRTWLRRLLPFWAIELGLATKGADCEAVGGRHEWYNQDGVNSGCYHCRKVVRGQLWLYGDADILVSPPFDE